MTHAPHRVLSGLALCCLASCGAGLLSLPPTLGPFGEDVAVLAVHDAEADVERAARLAARARVALAAEPGVRVLEPRALREAIAVQLEGASLRPSDRAAILAEVGGVDAYPELGLAILRRHRTATVVDEGLRSRARTLFFQAAADALARGDDDHAQRLLLELHGWLSFSADAPGPFEVPRSVADLYAATEGAVDGGALYQHTRPFLTLLPHGLEHLALTNRGPGLAPEVVEQAARLGVVTRVSEVILVGYVSGEPRAFVVDVGIRSFVREARLDP